MLRLPVGLSSISARMTRRSSVAETTGNSTTNAQERQKTLCKVLNLRWPGVRTDSRQSHNAGIASSSQLRFSRSSMHLQLYR